MLLGGSGFSVQPIQRICEGTDVLLCFCNEKVLVIGTADAATGLPTLEAVLALLPKDIDPFHLFNLDGRSVFCVDVSLPLDLPEGSPLCFHPAGVFRSLPSRQDGFILATAWHLISWYRRNRFCGACGQPLSHSSIERALCCAACGQLIYPTISPAVSVAITDGDRLLLAKGRRGFGHFALVAGYVEAGETLEETVRREVLEEVGLRVKNIRYVGSQAWGWSQSEMIGFHAELDGPGEITIQESELSDARWFHREELTPDPDPASLSFTMIELFRQGKL